MRPPIFVVDDAGDLQMFESAERACSFAESPDVEEGVYKAAYDADGTRLEFYVTKPTKRSRFLWWTTLQLTPVSIRALESQPSGAEDLRQLLSRAVPGAPARAGLEELVALARRQL